MSKKVTPQIRVIERNTSLQPSTSNMSKNNSYLHERYQPHQEGPAIPCFHCKVVGTSSLRRVCDCVDRLFHQGCLKLWIKARMSKSSARSEDNDIKSVKCDSCDFDIKFQEEARCRVKNCNEIGKYAAENSCVVASIVIPAILMLAALVVLVLVLAGTIDFNNDSQKKSLLVIAMGCIVGIMLILTLGFCLHCLRKDETIIIPLDGERERRSHQSHRSHQSYRTNRTHRTHRTNNHHRSSSRVEIHQLE